MKAFEKIRGTWIKLAARISYAFGIVDDRAASASFRSGSRRWRASLGSAAYDSAN